MGNLIDKGLVPKDDPMFSGGPEIFSRHESSESTKNSAKSTDGAKDTKLQNSLLQKESSSRPRPMDEQQMFDQDHEHLTGEQRAKMLSVLIRATAESKAKREGRLEEEAFQKHRAAQRTARPAKKT